MIRILLILLLCQGCSQERPFNSQINYEKSSNLEKSDLDLEGQWKFVFAIKEQGTPFLRTYPNPYTPAYEVGPPEPPYDGPDFIFKQDSCYQVVYPKYMYYRNRFSVDSGYLHLHHKFHTELFPIEWRDDTLFIYKPFLNDEYIKEVYVKTSFNDSVMEILKTNPANYPELAGTWYLVRFDSGNDGTYYELDFPHEVPDSIEISRDDFLRGIENNNTYKIMTDGELKDYTFTYRWGSLVFTPDDWFKGDKNGLRFEQRN